MKANQKGSVAIAITVVLGALIIAGIVYIYMKASDESTRIYDGMVKDMLKDNAETPKYGYGVDPDASVLPGAQDIKDTRKPKPVVYIRPTKLKGK